MAYGTLAVDTLNSSTGVLASNNGMTGIAKAWVNFNGTSGASPVIRASFNVSSVTRNSTGNYTVTYGTAQPSANYCWAYAGNNSDDTLGTVNSTLVVTTNALQTTSSLTFVTKLNTGSSSGLADMSLITITVFGA